MRNQFFKGLAAITAMLAMATLPASAFSLSQFTYNSKLSTGKWVKITIPEDGIYQITAEQLAEMGFSDLNSVQIYGQGGHERDEDEVLKATIADDLVAVPMMVSHGKVIFYAEGTVGKVLNISKDGNPYYDRTRNAFSNAGYYFITESSDQKLVNQQSTIGSSTKEVNSSYAMFLHEAELFSPGLTGRHLKGELMYPDRASIDFVLPQRSDRRVTVLASSVCLNKGHLCYFSSTIDCGDESISVPFNTEECYFSPAGTKEVQRHFTSQKCASRIVTLSSDSVSRGKINCGINNISGATISWAALDYLTITYKRKNTYAHGASSFTMGFTQLDGETFVAMPGTDSATVVWNVTDAHNVTQMQLETIEGNIIEPMHMGFTPEATTEPAEFIAFNPSLELKQIGGYKAIDNQNLHGLSTPNMLIVTNEYFKPEAERLAQIHRDNDGITVHVVDQEQVFNEFSSGTPDPMAIRLLCKMFYDRGNKQVLKNLLMFGPATYDFRGITTHKPNCVIVYADQHGDTDAESYSTDDFFGVLEDNSGHNMKTEKLCIGVGRMTPIDLAQARQDVDKVAHYVLNPDYGVWRNHYTLWADMGVSANNDLDLHILQAEGIDNKIQDYLGIPMVADKAYIDEFPSPSEARRHVIDQLNRGQYYANYVGHANPKSFTSYRMWTLVDVRSQNYSQLPIFMTACCDVARFDGVDQGIAELMLHQPDGGAIALVTSTREAEAAGNDRMNQSFTEALLSYNYTGQMQTLGEAYKAAKLSSRMNLDDAKNNKMSFILLGDPAIKVEYPRPLFNITRINGVNVDSSSVTLSPLQTVTVEADVLCAGSTSVDDTFTGDATLSIYDTRRLLRHTSHSGYKLEGDVYYPRDLLTEVQGRVEGGHFTGTAVMPRYIKAQPGEDLAISVYAHKTGTSEMVNGICTNITAATYDEQQAVQDDGSPVIEAMYLNEQASFEQGMPVGPSSTLHVTATDDVAFNNQSMGVGSSAKLTLDGSTHYTQINNFVNIGNGGKSLQLHFPIAELSAGQHSLTITVQDIVGNIAERTITFMVAGETKMSLKTGDLVAIDEAVIDLDDNATTATPAMTLKVVNARGDLVWSTTTSTLPYTWNLTDTQGQRVAPGLYKLFGQFNDGASYGGTNIMPIIVMAPVARSDQ